MKTLHERKRINVGKETNCAHSHLLHVSSALVVAMESVVSPGRFFSSLLLSTGISKVAGCWS